jgi:uncharacterized protein with von Willebrand factor type A (vWA) domain
MTACLLAFRGDAVYRSEGSTATGPLQNPRAIGQTSLYDGIAAALDHLKQGNRDKKVLILISDGGDNASKHTLAQVIGMAKQSTAIIYAIGIFR